MAWYILSARHSHLASSASGWWLQTESFLFLEFSCSCCPTSTSCLGTLPILPAWLLANQHFTLLYFIFLKIYLLVICNMFSCTPEEGIRSYYRWLWATMWLQGIEFRTSWRTVSALNLWAISPALPNPLERALSFILGLSTFPLNSSICVRTCTAGWHL